MQIRHAVMEDLDKIMDIYAYARKFMAQTGNPRQWGATCWPPRDLIRRDIEIGKSYVCVDKSQNDEAQNIQAVFYYDFGKDIEPCYGLIEEGR